MIGEVNQSLAGNQSRIVEISMVAVSAIYVSVCVGYLLSTFLCCISLFYLRPNMWFASYNLRSFVYMDFISL